MSNTELTCSAQSTVENDASEPCAAGFPESSVSAPFTKVNQAIYTWAQASGSYPAPNILESSPTLDKSFTFKYGVVFVDPLGHCDILRLPHRNNACEVWSQQIDQVTELCHFVVDLLCGPQKHIVYNEEYCEGK
ncbi:hypothetical protein MRX96_008656 [Rhipicephalus microplus]